MYTCRKPIPYMGRAQAPGPGRAPAQGMHVLPYIILYYLILSNITSWGVAWRSDLDILTSNSLHSKTQQFPLRHRIITMLKIIVLHGRAKNTFTPSYINLNVKLQRSLLVCFGSLKFKV